MSSNISQAPLLPSQAAARLFGGDLALLEEGLKRGLRVDAIWPMWEMPLLHGVCLFCPPKADEMAKAIILAGANPSEKHNGLSPMMIALGGYNREDGDPHGNRLAMIKTLHQEDPTPDMDLWAMAAVRLGFLDAMEFFLDAGCDPNGALEGGHSLLHEAYKQKNALIGNLLVTRGADPHALNSSGQDPAAAVSGADGTNQTQDEPGVMSTDLQALDLAIRILKDPKDMPEGRQLRL